MNCMFGHEPCQYIKCPAWSERLQACRIILAIDKFLGMEKPKAQLTPTEQKIVEAVIINLESKKRGHGKTG